MSGCAPHKCSKGTGVSMPHLAQNTHYAGHAAASCMHASHGACTMQACVHWALQLRHPCAHPTVHVRCRPARIGPCSCVPPPYPEPFRPPSASLVDMMTMHDQLRELQVHGGPLAILR